MSAPRRIYLDNAATSWPKPEPVYRAVESYLRDLGAPAGRSGYFEASQAERIVAEARRRMTEFIGADDPRRIIFTANGTDSLNLALHGLLRPGEHVVTTSAEHNSVLRPLRHLEETRQISVTRVPCDSDGEVSIFNLHAAVTPKTRLVALTHASNVTGALQPIEMAAKLAAENDAVLLVDAAQSLGHVPFNVQGLGACVVAAPAHKGLLAPLGLGVLYVAPGVEERLDSVRQGGTGTRSEWDRQPDSLPDKYEAGNHNLPAIAGLAAALEWIVEQRLENLHAQEQRLTQRLLSGLDQIAGVTVYGPRKRRVGVVSFTIDGLHAQEASVLLDNAARVQTRAGLHCAPLMHEALGTQADGGTVRISLGPFNTEQDIDQALAAIEEIVGAVA